VLLTSILGTDNFQFQAPTAILEEYYIIAYSLPRDGNSYPAGNQTVLWRVQSHLKKYILIFRRLIGCRPTRFIVAWIFGIQVIYRGSRVGVLLPTGHNCWPRDKCINDTKIHFSVSPPLVCRNLCFVVTGIIRTTSLMSSWKWSLSGPTKQSLSI